MNNTIYLPTLKKVRIVNYSLYNQNIDYDFIYGVNLIIGGNGVGKTTFINIIKYALIGLYKKDLIVRNYNNEKRLIRTSYTNCNVYFRNRTQENLEDQKGFVELHFDINDVKFVVKRSLYNTELLSAVYEENGKVNVIPGQVIRQDIYAKYENYSNVEKEKYLQYNYEKVVSEKANLSDFNDFIFFVNQILLFSEARDNVLWDEEAQNRLLSNYLNDSQLEKKRKELNFEAKYQDSIARHRQEEIKAIRRVQKKVDENSRTNKEISKPDLLNQIEIQEKNIQLLETARNELQRKIALIYKEVSVITNKINEKEKLKEKEEIKDNKQYWIGLNPKYRIYKKQLFFNHICPMCNSPIEENQEEIDDDQKCCWCHSSLKTSKVNNDKIEKLRKDINELSKVRKEKELLISKNEKELNKLDYEVRKSRLDLFEKRQDYRAMEDKEAKETQNESTYITMLKRIDELALEKEEAARLSEKYKEEGNKIVKCIEENLISNTRVISDIFKDFAEAFLHVPCHLTFDSVENKEVKRFFPVIDGKIRYDAEELSESQRFFVDYSFRMSILSYFYNSPSFYICETPDSSLDISYEENAANTLLKYVARNNTLILTSNLNNSTFLKSILTKTDKIKVLNLLNYGKASIVQKQHKELQNLSKEIEEIVNG